MKRFGSTLFVLIFLFVIRARAGDVGKPPPQFRVPERHHPAELVAEGGRKELINNDRVRVVELTVVPHEKLPMHSHPAHIIYALSDGKTKFTFPDRKTATETMKKGEVEYHAPVTHAAENVGKKSIRLLLVELKDNKTPLPPKPQGADPAKIAAKNVKVLFDNERVRVLEGVLKPGDKEAAHAHPTLAVYVINGGKMKYTMPDGSTRESVLKADEAMFREPTAHATENVGKTDIHVIVFELKDGAKKK